MIPAPMPVPILTTTTSSWPAATPDRHSPSAEDVDVVVDPDRRPVALGEPLADRVAVPARHDRRRDRPAGLELDRARARAIPTPHSRPGIDWVVRSSELEQLIDPVEAGLRAGLDPGGLVVVAEDPPVEVRERDVDARGAEVGDEDVAGVGAERELARWPAAGARPDLAFDDQAALEQLADALGDDRPAETGPRDQLGAGSGPPEADLVEHHDERIERLVGHGRRGSGVASSSVTPRSIRPLRPLVERLLHLTGQSRMSATARRGRIRDAAFAAAPSRNSCTSRGSLAAHPHGRPLDRWERP